MAVSGRRRAAAVVLHADRPRRPDARAMDAAQHRAAMRLLRTGLSEAAYVTASTIIGLENVLDAVEGWRSSFGRERGRDPGMYYVRVFGEPGSGGDVGMAVRRPPRVGEPHRRRWRAGVVDTVLPRCRSGPCAAPRAAPAPAARWRRGPRARSGRGRSTRPSVLRRCCRRSHRWTSSRPTGPACREGDRPLPLGAIFEAPSTVRWQSRWLVTRRRWRRRRAAAPAPRRARADSDAEGRSRGRFARRTQRDLLLPAARRLRPPCSR